MNNTFTASKRRRAHTPMNLTVPPTTVIPVWFGTPMLVVDWEQREICRGDGRCQKLSRREMALLACLAARAGKIVSRDEIPAQVWKLNPNRTTTRTIDMHISMLRRKLGDDAQKPTMLVTLRRVGYMLRAGMLCDRDEESTGRAANRGAVLPTASREGTTAL